MMSSLALAAMTRLCPFSQRTVLHNRTSWLIPVVSCNYAKSAEEKLGLEKPKRPVTAFLKFATQMRPALKAKNPDISTLQIMKLASKHWHQLGHDAKSKMTKEYQENLEDYRKLKATYEASLTDTQKKDVARVRQEIFAAKEKRKFKNELKELGKPKRPMSSYLLFSQTEKSSFGDLGMAEYQSKMKAKWDALTPAEKSKWESKALVLMDQYRKDLQEWEEKMVKEGHAEYIVARRTPAEGKKSKSKVDK